MQVSDACSPTYLQLLSENALLTGSFDNSDGIIHKELSTAADHLEAVVPWELEQSGHDVALTGFCVLTGSSTHDDGVGVDRAQITEVFCVKANRILVYTRAVSRCV